MDAFIPERQDGVGRGLCMDAFIPEHQVPEMLHTFLGISYILVGQGVGMGIYVDVEHMDCVVKNYIRKNRKK